MAERDLNQPIVIDQGSGTTKAGFAGSDHPNCYFPSYVGELGGVSPSFPSPRPLLRTTYPELQTAFEKAEARAGLCWSPSLAGRPKHTRVMAGAVEGDTFVGKKAQELRGLLRIK